MPITTEEKKEPLRTTAVCIYKLTYLDYWPILNLESIRWVQTESFGIHSICSSTW